MGSRRIAGRLQVDTVNKTDIERIATSNGSDTYPSASLYYTTTEQSLPRAAKTGTFFFTTQDRSLWLGTGDNIARIRVASDVISATDYYTRNDVIQLFLSKEDAATVKADIASLASSLKMAQSDIASLYSQMSLKAAKDEVYSKTAADEEFLNAGEMETGLAKKVNSTVTTADNFKQSVVKNTVGGVTIKFDNVSQNRFSEIQVADSRVYIAADTTDLNGDGSRLYVTPDGVFYTRNKNLNATDYTKSYDKDKDELVTQKQHLELQDICYAADSKSNAATQAVAIAEGNLSVFRTSLTSAINTMNNAKFQSDDAMSIASGAQSLTAQLQSECVSLRTDLYKCQQDLENANRRTSLALDEVYSLQTKVDINYVQFEKALQIATQNIANLSNILAIAYATTDLEAGSKMYIRAVHQPYSVTNYLETTDLLEVPYGTDLEEVRASLINRPVTIDISENENATVTTSVKVIDMVWNPPSNGYNSHYTAADQIFLGTINDTVYSNTEDIHPQAHVRVLPSTDPTVPTDDGVTWSAIFIMPVGIKTVHDFKNKLQSQLSNDTINFNASDIAGIPIDETTVSEPLVILEMIGRIREDSDTLAELEDIRAVTVEELNAMNDNKDIILYRQTVKVPVQNGLPDLDERLLQQRIELLSVDSILVSNGSVDYKDATDTLEFTHPAITSIIYRLKKIPLT